MKQEKQIGNAETLNSAPLVVSAYAHFSNSKLQMCIYQICYTSHSSIFTQHALSPYNNQAFIYVEI